MHKHKHLSLRTPVFPHSVANFCGESSIPGFSRLASLHSASLRWLWLVLLVLGFIGFLTHMSVNASRYLAHERSTQTQNDAEPFIFPDITICPQYPLSASRLGKRKSWNISSRDMGTVNITPAAFFYKMKDFWNAERNNSRFIGQYTRSDNLISRKSLRGYVDGFGLAKRSDEVIMECFYQEEPCNARLNFTTFQYPYYENCWTFRPNNRDVFGSGPDHGLRLLLNTVDRRAYLTDKEIIDNLRGVLVMVHGPGTIPVPQDGHLVAAVGTLSRVAIDMTTYRRLHTYSKGTKNDSSYDGMFKVSTDTSNETGTVTRVNDALKKHTCVPEDVIHENELNIASMNWDREITRKINSSYHPQLCRNLETQLRFMTECGCISEHLMMPAPLNEAATRHTLPYCHTIPFDVLQSAQFNAANDLIFVILDGENVTFSRKATNSNEGTSPRPKFTQRGFTDYFRLIRATNESIARKFSQTASAAIRLPFQIWKEMPSVQEIVRRKDCHERLEKTLKMKNTHLERHLRSRCPAACVTNEYSATHSSYSWPDSTRNSKPALISLLETLLKQPNISPDTNRTLRLTMNHSLNNLTTIQFAFLKLEVFPKSKSATVVQETFTYPFSAFLSDTGGILGLWAGMSIITIIEMAGSCFAIFHHKKSKTVTQISNNTVDFAADNVDTNCTTGKNYRTNDVDEEYINETKRLNWPNIHNKNLQYDANSNSERHIISAV